MSSNIVPVCGSCGNSSTVSISCTKCLKICCSACFSGLVSAMMTTDIDIALLTARVCRKCQTSNEGEGAGTEADVKDHKIAVTQGQCSLHGKKRKLYCINCSVDICGTCIDQGEPHNFHRIDNLDAVYLDKASTVRAKLFKAEKLNQDMFARSAVYRKNLLEIEEAEQSVLKEIEAVYEASKLAVTRITTIRKEALQAKLNVPTMNSEVLKNLWDDARKLSPYELLQQVPAFEIKCGGLMAQDNDIELQKVDDIYCDLVPQYQFTEIVFRSFSKTADGKFCVFHLQTAYHCEWKFTVKKSNMLQIEPEPVDPEMQKFRHMLVVIIKHPDYMKTVNHTFELEGQPNTFDVAYSADLVEQGYCTKRHGNLVLRVGIRGLNALIERQIMKYQYNQVSENIKKPYDKYLTMSFRPKLDELQNGVTLKSCQIKDNQNRCWGLLVLPVSNNVGFFLELMKGPGAANFFAELIHSDPTKTIIRTSSKCTLDTFLVSYAKGWPKFISLDTLNNDAGFHPNGQLHIRFGVCPVETAAPGEANA